MSYDRYRVSVESLENGFAVEVPDLDEMARKMKEAKAKTKSGECCPMPYMGDCTKKFAAKSVKEVLKIVGAALEKMPEAEYDSAFEEASTK